MMASNLSVDLVTIVSGKPMSFHIKLLFVWFEVLAVLFGVDCMMIFRQMFKEEDSLGSKLEI